MPNTPLRGDRSAHDDIGYPALHAKDLDSGTPIHHLPEAQENYLPVFDGLKWVGRQIAYLLSYLGFQFTSPEDGDVLTSEQGVWVNKSLAEAGIAAADHTHEGGTGGVTDHGELTGLADDDHTQYHTDARGDARYSPLVHDHAGVYAPAAQGVTGGNSHDHNGGDGAKIPAAGITSETATNGYVLTADGSGNTSWTAKAGGASDHGALTGLGDDDHSQYVANGIARTITAQHTFDPSAPSTQPFAIGNNAWNVRVPGLNADQLDFRDASYFAVSNHTHSEYASLAHSHGLINLTDHNKANHDALGINAAALQGNAASAFALAGHNHSGVYAPASHSHTGLYVPLTSRVVVVNGTALSVGTYDYYLPSYGLPGGLSAVSLILLGRWTATGGQYVSAFVYGSTIENYAIVYSVQANTFNQGIGVCPVVSDRIRVIVGGANTNGAYVVVTGYYL